LKKSQVKDEVNTVLIVRKFASNPRYSELNKIVALSNRMQALSHGAGGRAPQ
jgi:hypothetical protein